MSISRASSDLTLCSPFLLKFQGRLGQISKHGTLSTHQSKPFLERDPRKAHSSVLTEKRAENIILDLAQIKSKNAQEYSHLSHFSNRRQTHHTQTEGAEKTISGQDRPIRQEGQGISLHSSCPLRLNVMMEGSLSRDFETMLRELQSLPVGKRK